MISIQPLSVKSNIQFGQKVKKQQPKPEYNQPYYSQEYLEKEKDFSFLKGALCAAIIMSGVHQCSNMDRKSMLDEAAAIVNYSEPKGTILKLEDINNDEALDLIVEDNDGHQTIFDLENKHQYYKDKFGTEKIY